MGEGRGKLEALIVDLEAKKAELEKLIQEYDLMLPHLSSAREALDNAGITESIAPPAAAVPPAAPQPQPAAAAAAAPAAEPAPVEAAPEPAAVEAEPEPEVEAAPARRSIASLVAEDDGSGDEATH